MCLLQLKHCARSLLFQSSQTDFSDLLNSRHAQIASSWMNIILRITLQAPCGQERGFLYLWVPGIEEECTDITIGRILPSHVIRLFQHTRTLSRLLKCCAQLLQLPNELFHTQKNSATDETIFQKTWTLESLWIQWSSSKHFYLMPWTQKGCQGCHALSVVWT